MCTGTTTTLTNATPGGVWSSSHTAIATVNSSGVVTGLAAGAVTINYTVTGACGTATQPFQITVNTAPVVPDVTGSNNVCVGASITLANTLAGGTWSSNSPAIATVNNSGVVTGVATGAVVIRYSVANSCGTTTKDFNLSVNDRPVVAAVTGLDSIFIGNNMQLQNATPGGIWSSSAPNIASISTAGMVSGLTAGTSTISYTVTNACGSATRTKVITVVAISDDVFIPNAFTPNNDGLNDAFQVYGMGIRELQLQVYNQWGERIFETKDIAGKWNGLHKGVAQPSGMYVYTARVQLANGVVLVKKGAIHLIR
jgi:gliding motility-associated-like protein